MLEKVIIIQGVASAVIAFVVGLAVMGDSTLATPFVKSIIAIPNYFAFLSLVISFFYSRKTFKPANLLLLLFVIYWFLQTFHTYSTFSPSILQFSIILLLLFSCVCDDALRYGYRIYKILLTIMAVAGVIAYISYILSLNIPYSIEPYYAKDGLTGWTYVNYGFAYIVQDLRGLRLCGLFNEPGLFGTILALVLIADKLNFKRKDNIILFVAGVLSFSLAFFLLIFIFLLLYLLNHGVKVKYIIYFIIAIIVIYYTLTILMEQNEMVAYLVERIHFEDGALVGDNRTNELFDKYYLQMFSDGKFLLGYGHGFNSIIGTGGLSYKKVVLEYGIIGVIILWGLLLAEALKRNRLNKMGLIFIICFFASIYQRPSVLSLNYFLILFGGIAYIHSLTENDVIIDLGVTKKKFEKVLQK